MAPFKRRWPSQSGGERPVRIAYGTSRCQFGELWRPSSVPTSAAIPLVVLYHGGYWRSRYTRRLMDPLAWDITQRGWAAWNVEYRRVGTTGGGGGFPQTFDDALRALRAAVGLEGVDTNRVVTCGHSAGGHLALWAASAASGLDEDRSPRHSGVAASVTPIPPLLAAVSLAGVVDLIGAAEQALGDGAVSRLMGGAPSEHPDRYREVSLVDALPLGVPQIVVHGTADTVVPPSMSESYAGIAQRAGDAVELLMVQATDHMGVIDPGSQAWRLAVDRIAGLMS